MTGEPRHGVGPGGSLSLTDLGLMLAAGALGVEFHLSARVTDNRRCSYHDPKHAPAADGAVPAPRFVSGPGHMRAIGSNRSGPDPPHRYTDLP